jgi:hypothetical protein
MTDQPPQRRRSTGGAATFRPALSLRLAPSQARFVEIIREVEDITASQVLRQALDEMMFRELQSMAKLKPAERDELAELLDLEYPEASS